MAASMRCDFESTKAEQLLEELKEYDFRFCSVSSAPSVGTFNSLQKTISYHGYFGKATVLSFFRISSDILTTNQDEVICVAVTRLKNVLNDPTLLKSVIEGLERSENEKEQFVYVSSLLRNLTGTFSFNVREYSAKLFSKLKVNYQPDLIG